MPRGKWGNFWMDSTVRNGLLICSIELRSLHGELRSWRDAMRADDEFFEIDIAHLTNIIGKLATISHHTDTILQSPRVMEIFGREKICYQTQNPIRIPRKTRLENVGEILKSVRELLIRTDFLGGDVTKELETMEQTLGLLKTIVFPDFSENRRGGRTNATTGE